jgi:hypothetical protein
MEPLAVPGYLKAFSRVKIIKDKDNYSCIFLEHEMPVTLQKPRIWAWADLPVYSGLLDNDTGLCAERLDLQGILQNAWDDLNSLLSHARLREYKRNNALELIDRAMKLRRMFSSILADNGFKPLYDERDIGENEYKSVGRYIENALARDFAFPFRQVILAQAPYNCTSVCEAGENKILAVAKWGNCKSYDGTIDLSQERGYFCAACAGESGGPEANESPARLQIHSIERHAGGSADTFETADPAFWNTEAPGFSVKSPDRSLPFSPVFISQERKQEARTAVTVFQWAAVHNDHLNIVISPSSVRRELRANAAKNIDGVSDVYDMYKYNESRPGLIEGGAGVLMDALGHYLSALERFMGQRKHSGHSDNGGDYGSIWTVYAENGYLSRIECENAAAGTADISLSYQIGMGEKIAMHREGAVYRFEKDKAPAEGQPFVIFLTIENSENVSCELRAFRREEGMTDHFTRRTAFVGNAIEEGDSLV